MRKNACKQKWTSGEVAYGAWLMIPSTISAEAVAHQGFDYVCVDMQHGFIDYADAVVMLQAISLSKSMPFVRVPWNEPGIIGRVLDAGAMGVIIPMVNSADEARAAVSACRYHPLGGRSYGPSRASWYGGADYFEHANEEVACIPMIETARSVEHLDEILAVPGIDAVYVGPSDLSVTYGQTPRPDNDGAFEAARIKIATACAARGITAGIHANASLAAKHAAAGYRMVTISADISSLQGRMGEDLARARAEA